MMTLEEAELDLASAREDYTSATCYLMALRFLRALDKAGLPLPAACADPDGEVSLDWCVSHRFSVSINAVGRLAYACSNGEHGNAHFRDEMIPDEIRKYLAS